MQFLNAHWNGGFSERKVNYILEGKNCQLFRVGKLVREYECWWDEH